MVIQWQKVFNVMVLVNLSLTGGVFVYFYRQIMTTNANRMPTNDKVVQYIDQCGEECKKYVDLKFKIQNSNVKTVGPSTPVTKVIYQTTPKTKVKSTTYVTLAGSGSTTATDWVNVSGSDFYFSPEDYPGLVSVYFEANMKLLTGSGRAYVRLFDVTHGIGVQGSEASTQAGTDMVVESGQVSFWAGKNLIRVQIKSLTTESTVYNSGRLRIITEN
ncbi:MAG: hypothetical protein UX52_C0011G0019 [Candidatus Amesbacteria bacterium GW2011_GWA1_46_35]|uniref:Uncharacterized protein n=1 Tax=Candidatus Amesbacteria bacterium GW2011_GWC2_45_19 TaxID=1618366 RepID=A0A0G1PB80_9BACT|nr:MAG: hypothetical protein UX05_C0010G0015 [Candidatus Amesbacteria bacterium GW2011_GWC2_45_19]KKU38089.1 MAG: hypothetical protein UX52_C0011G0019 [Candidatus Amesbacteria bacterium GW2011_GWA1_46_35]KKU69062.1 MAG: hypothetical protein UX93_C0003G0054 [Microgenomates group bacterium GW2011_GWC1_47_20]